MDLDGTFKRLTGEERDVLLDFCDLLLFTLPDIVPSRRAYLDIIGARYLGIALKVWAGQANIHARMVSGSDESSQRRRGTSGLLQLRQAIVERSDGVVFAHAPASAPGEPSDLAALRRLPGTDTRCFIHRVYWSMFNRGPSLEELAHWDLRLNGTLEQRDELLALGRAMLDEFTRAELARANGNGPAFCIMGIGTPVTLGDWQARAAELATNPASAATAPITAPTYPLPDGPRPLVSVITSLYAGGAHVERFMDNLTGQRGFSEWAELIIVDAASPDGEAPVIERHASVHDNIRYIRCPERIGIYEAWNLAISHARGEYLTNANLDDLRREDSLALQAAALHQHPDADVVYQDFFYTLQPELSYEAVAAMGYRTALPDRLDVQTMMHFNPPHHAPMWRRRLHDELGGFDQRYQSAGDYDFWLRCLAAGKRFHKIDAPHAVYFQNPRGVSTRPGTAGLAEARQILRRHGSRLGIRPRLAC